MSFAASVILTVKFCSSGKVFWLLLFYFSVISRPVSKSLTEGWNCSLLLTFYCLNTQVQSLAIWLQEFIMIFFPSRTRTIKRISFVLLHWKISAFSMQSGLVLHFTFATVDFKYFILKYNLTTHLCSGAALPPDVRKGCAFPVLLDKNSWRLRRAELAYASR